MLVSKWKLMISVIGYKQCHQFTASGAYRIAKICIDGGKKTIRPGCFCSQGQCCTAAVGCFGTSWWALAFAAILLMPALCSVQPTSKGKHLLHLKNAMQTLNNSITVSHEATESFSDLPIDALVEIYRQLSSISDVINLSQTCRALQEIWLDNVVTIYTSVGPQSIPCERHALAFRGYQSQLRGPFNRTSITSRDVHQIMKNNKVIQKSIKDFEELFLPLGIKGMLHSWYLFWDNASFVRSMHRRLHYV